MKKITQSNIQDVFKKGGEKKGKRLSKNLIQFNDSGNIVFRLYATNIVTIHTNGTATLNNGGFPTLTTHRHMNKILNNHGFNGLVSSKNFVSHYNGKPFVNNQFSIHD